MTDEEIIKFLSCDDCKFATCEQCEINYTTKKAIKDLIEIQKHSINILIAQRDEAQKDSDRWFKKLQEEQEKHYKKRHELENRISELEISLEEEGVLLDE